MQTIAGLEGCSWDEGMVARGGSRKAFLIEPAPMSPGGTEMQVFTEVLLFGRSDLPLSLR